MLVSIAERIAAPIGATTCPLRVTATTHTAVLEIAVTIQPMSGSATTDSGGTTDSLTLRGGHVWDAPHQQAIENMVLPFDGRTNVRLWPKADIGSCSAHVCFWG